MNVRALGQTNDPTQDVAVAGIPIAPGVVALALVSVTRNVVSTPATTGAMLLLAANPNRLAAVVRNDATTSMHVDQGVIASVVPSGEAIVGPGQSVEINENNKGAIYGWFEGAPTGNVTTTELV